MLHDRGRRGLKVDIQFHSILVTNVSRETLTFSFLEGVFNKFP